MKIYIEHTDGVFYDTSGCGWDFASRNTDEVIRLCPVSACPTDKRDFEIGSRVYFQGVGWTEVKESPVCEGCAFVTSVACYDYPCSRGDRADDKYISFIPLNTDAPAPSEKSTNYFEMKNDNGKPRMDLLPFDAIKGVSDVLTFGANKYTPNGWKDVPDAIPRYEAALLRHFAAIKTGEQNDPESGLPHIYHLACNALFLASLMTAEKRGEGK